MQASNVSLSQEILFGSLESVVKLVNQGADVNEKDKNGFTPLIEATLKADMQIARLLLQHGAKIDQEDISGQTALQWAVNRYQIPLCKLFLQYRADANHYSADGQPLLVNPMLREQQELIDLLVLHGAKIEFAQDFISAKLIGHRYELTGRGKIVSPEKFFIDINYEGFFLEFTVGIILRTLLRFMNSETGKYYQSYAAVLSKAMYALRQASQIIPYKFSTNGPEEHDEEIRKVLNEELVVIPVSYEGHAITFIKYGNLFAKCDRGVSHIVDTVVVYQVGNSYALNSDFLKDLMYNNKSDEYINTEIKKILNLQPFTTLPPRYQLSGNCSWANVEASIPAMMFMLMFRGNVDNRGEIAALKKSIMDYYDTWVEWDKDRVLEESISEFHRANKLRRYSKATILAAILFQRCKLQYKRDVERAKKILQILTLPDYNYILKSYLKVYFTKMAGKTGQDFILLLRSCGLDFTAMTLKSKQ
jgi:hypothetical protein